MTQANIKHTSQHIDNQSFDEEFQMRQTALVKYDDPDNPTAISRVNPATEEGQTAIVSAVQNITIPAPEGGATSVKQETLISLIGTLQELNARLTVIAGMANAGAPALRTIPIASVSTAVTGTVTATVASTVVSSLTNFGTGIPASEMAHDINNQTAILANINNVTP